MAISPQILFLNGFLNHCADPADLSRFMLQHYLAQDETGRAEFALAMIMEIGAREMVKRAGRRIG